MGDAPLFSGSVVECARDGSNSALSVTRSRKMVVSDVGIQVGKQRMPFESLSGVDVHGNVLTLTLRDEQGRNVERSFRHDTFLPGTGARRVAALAQRIAERVAPPAAATASVARAVRVESPRYVVRISSSQVAFPPVCPTCLAPGTRAATLDVSHTFDQGRWIVPVCAMHPTLGDGVVVENWRLRATELTFSFGRPDYGELFLAANAGPEGADPTRVEPALQEIQEGVRFVLYSYAVSAFVVSFKRMSGIRVVPARRSRIVYGLPYTSLSLLAGWWGIPHGPIFTIGSLITNLKGGVDLTPSLAAVIRGRRLSARGA